MRSCAGPETAQKEVEQMKPVTPEPEKAKVGQAKGRPEWSRRGTR